MIFHWYQIQGLNVLPNRGQQHLFSAILRVNTLQSQPIFPKSGQANSITLLLIGHLIKEKTILANSRLPYSLASLIKRHPAKSIRIPRDRDTLH